FAPMRGKPRLCVLTMSAACQEVNRRRHRAQANHESKMVISQYSIEIAHGLTMLERSHLTILQLVEREGSLTAAAQAMHITQSALSHTMRKLEQQIGTPVWHREGRSLRLTQVGQYLLAVANRVLPQLAQAEERV